MSNHRKKFFSGVTDTLLWSTAITGALILSLKYGAVDTPWSIVLDYLCGTGGSDAPDMMIIDRIRLPRTLCAMLSGAALAVSGAVLQSVLNNPLASPGVTGVSAGGGVAGILAILCLAGSPQNTVAATFCGAMAAALCIFMLTLKGRAAPLKIILAGVALSSICGAVSAALIFANSEKAGELLAFSVGSLAMRNQEELTAVFPFAALGFAGSVFMARRMDLLALGDETASSLGVPVFRTRVALLLFSALLAAYFNRGGLHAQVSAASAEQLIKARQNPADYRDLRVRVTGYSGVFVDMCERLQDDVIARFE